jgi:hypothetical protein
MAKISILLLIQLIPSYKIISCSESYFINLVLITYHWDNHSFLGTYILTDIIWIYILFKYLLEKIHMAGCNYTVSLIWWSVKSIFRSQVMLLPFVPLY